MASGSFRTPNKVPTYSDNENTTRLQAGNIYSGNVLSFDRSTESYTVELEVLQTPYPEVRYLTPIFSYMFGVNLNFIIPSGTPVRVLYTGEGEMLIIGVEPASLPEPSPVAKGWDNILDAGGSSDPGSDRPPLSSNPADDLLEGEVDLTNNLRVGVRILTAMAQLTAGDLAKVETIATDDLVRMISRQFAQHHGLGSTFVYNKGQPILEEYAAGNDKELWGNKDTEDDERFELDPDNMDVTFKGPGQWRYRRFLGYIGDMVHTIITDPAGAAEQFASGKARQQVMSDGTYLIQSTAEIVLERVCRIPVPAAAEGAKDVLERFEGTYAALWRGLSEYEDLQDKQKLAKWADISYQLREYARWLSSYHSYHKALETVGWQVPSENSTPAPDWSNQEKTTQDKNEGKLAYYDTYACIRIMRDGSLVLWSGDGSAITMGGGDVKISASRHMELYAPGDIRIRSGRDTHLHAKRHLNLAALTGGLKAKAASLFEMLVTQGTMWFKSDGESTIDAETSSGDLDEGVLPRDAGIILETSKSGIRVSSESDVLMESIGGNMEINSSGYFLAKALSSVNLKSVKDGISFESPKLIYGSTGVFLMNADQMQVTNKDGVAGFQVNSAGQLLAGSLIAKAGQFANSLSVGRRDTDSTVPPYTAIGRTRFEPNEDLPFVEYESFLQWLDIVKDQDEEFIPVMFRPGQTTISSDERLTFGYDYMDFRQPGRVRENLTLQSIRESSVPPAFSGDYEQWSLYDFLTVPVPISSSRSVTQDDSVDLANAFKGYELKASLNPLRAPDTTNPVDLPLSAEYAQNALTLYSLTDTADDELIDMDD